VASGVVPRAAAHAAVGGVFTRASSGVAAASTRLHSKKSTQEENVFAAAACDDADDNFLSGWTDDESSSETADGDSFNRAVANSSKEITAGVHQLEMQSMLLDTPVGTPPLAPWSPAYEPSPVDAHSPPLVAAEALPSAPPADLGTVVGRLSVLESRHLRMAGSAAVEAASETAAAAVTAAGATAADDAVKKNPNTGAAGTATAPSATEGTAGVVVKHESAAATRAAPAGAAAATRAIVVKKEPLHR